MIAFSSVGINMFMESKIFDLSFFKKILMLFTIAILVLIMNLIIPQNDTGIDI